MRRAGKGRLPKECPGHSSPRFCLLARWTALLLLVSSSVGQLQDSQIGATILSTANAQHIDSGIVLPNSTSSAAHQLLSCINQAYQPQLMTWDRAMGDQLVALRALGAWWSAKPDADNVPVTVVTVSTLDRLPQLEAQCRSWRGATSAAVFLPVVELGETPHSGRVKDMNPANRALLERAVNETSALFAASESDPAMCRLDILLVYEVLNDKQAEILFPVNSLRNLARLQARTPLMALIDVDLTISSTLYPSLLNDKEGTRRMAVRAGTGVIFILPAFETVNDSKRAAAMADRIVKNRDKSFVRRAVHNMGALRPFASARARTGHMCTEFDRWYTSGKEEYTVRYRAGCEPWVIVDRLKPPWHDVRFTGYGMNKVMHIRHMHALKFKFVVHPTAFLVHRPHRATAARKQWLEDSGNVTGNGNNQTQLETSTMRQRYLTLAHELRLMMEAGTYRPAIDNATRVCSQLLPWWADLPGVQRH